MRILITVLLMFSFTCYGQGFRKYTKMPDSVFVKVVVGKKISYTFKQYTFENSGKIIKVRMDKRLTFADEGMEEQKSIVPHIFMSDDTTDLPILMIDQYSKLLYGFSLYKLNGLESVKIGFLPVAALAPGADTQKEFTPSASIADKLLLETDGTQVQISFTCDQIILWPSSDKEEIVDGKQAKFLYNGKKLKEVEEF